jgi:hypothetical protein
MATEWALDNRRMLDVAIYYPRALPQIGCTAFGKPSGLGAVLLGGPSGRPLLILCSTRSALVLLAILPSAVPSLVPGIMKGLIESKG